MTRSSFLLGLVCCLVAASCHSAPKVRSSYDARVDFTRLRTFSLVHPNHPVPAPGGVDPFTVFRLRQMAHATLTKHGYRPVALETRRWWVKQLAHFLTRMILLSSWRSPVPSSSRTLLTQ